jgi:hypothetical protein
MHNRLAPKLVLRALFSLVLVLSTTPSIPAAHATASSGSISFVRTGTGGSPTNNQWIKTSIADSRYTFNANTDFTVEAWAKFSTLDSFQSFLGQHGQSGTPWILQMNNDKLRLYSATGGFPTIDSPVTFVTNKWYHIALVRYGTAADNIKIYVNGVAGTGKGSYNLVIGDSTKFHTIGSGGGGNDRMNGNLSNIRYVNGTAIYTGDFTPPTSPLTAVTNTVLLLNTTNDVNYLKDNSTFNVPFTTNDDSCASFAR